MRIPLTNRSFSVGRTSAIPLALVLLLGLSLTRCDSLPDHGPASFARVSVMSQNLYLGGPIFRLVEDPACEATAQNPIAPALCADQIYGQIEASDFAARAEAIADEIASARPALVGLQEVSTFYTQVPADNFPNGPNTPATDVTIDFLDLLLDALADRGLAYSAVSANLNLDLELPATPDGQTFYDVRYQDEDVVLALDDPDVTTGATSEVTFETLFEFVIAGIPLELGRGYQTVDATVDGHSFTFVNTHLEIAEIAPIRDAQAAELDAAIQAIAGSVILVGDLNGTPEETGTAPYPVLTATMSDVFDRPNLEAQPTCCQAPDLLNEESALDKRIDYVLYRDFHLVRSAETVLDEPDDRVESGGQLLWPSDHAGVRARLVHNPRQGGPNA